jgi:hypothetical protein
VILQIEITDDSSLRETKISLDNGTKYEEMEYNYESGLFECRWDTKEIKPSVIYLRATDILDNTICVRMNVQYAVTSLPSDIVIFADNSPPKIRLLNLSNGTLTKGRVVIEINITDDSSVKIPEISFDNWTTCHELTFNHSTGHFQYVWNSYVERPSHICIRAEDVLNNTGYLTLEVEYSGDGNSTTSLLTIDLSPPEITVLQPVVRADKTSTIQVNVLVTDSSNILYVQVRFKEAMDFQHLECNISSGYYYFFWDPTCDSSETICIRAVDEWNNAAYLNIFIACSPAIDKTLYLDENTNPDIQTIDKTTDSVMEEGSDEEIPWPDTPSRDTGPVFDYIGFAMAAALSFLICMGFSLSFSYPFRKKAHKYRRKQKKSYGS